MATEQKTEIHRLFFRLRRFWRLPGERPLVTPALGGAVLLAATGLGLTAAGWALVRLLPNRELIEQLAKDLPDGFWAFCKSLPTLLSSTTSGSVLVTGAVVSEEAFLLTYACGAAACFCFLLVLVAFVRKW